MAAIAGNIPIRVNFLVVKIRSVFPFFLLYFSTSFAAIKITTTTAKNSSTKTTFFAISANKLLIIFLLLLVSRYYYLRNDSFLLRTLHSLSDYIKRKSPEINSGLANIYDIIWLIQAFSYQGSFHFLCLLSLPFTYASHKPSLLSSRLYCRFWNSGFSTSHQISRLSGSRTIPPVGNHTLPRRILFILLLHYNALNQ